MVRTLNIVLTLLFLLTSFTAVSAGYYAQFEEADEDYVDFGPMAGFMAGNSWTIIEKAKVPEGSDTYGWHTFRGKAWEDKQGDIAFRLRDDRADDSIVIWLRKGGWQSLRMDNGTNGVDIHTDTWYTLAVVYNKTSNVHKLYVDGVETVSNSGIGPMDDSSNSNRLFFGGQDVDPRQRRGDLYSETDSAIAHQAWLQRALSPAEIAAYDGHVDPSDPALFFSTDINATGISDASGNGHDGTNGNSPEFLPLAEKKDVDLTDEDPDPDTWQWDTIYSDSIVMSLGLRDEDGLPLQNQSGEPKTVYMQYYDDTDWLNVTEDTLSDPGDGDTELTYVLSVEEGGNLDEVPGTYEVRFVFGGDSDYNALTQEGELTIYKETPVIGDLSSTVAYGSSVNISVTVEDDDWEELDHQADEPKSFDLKVLDGGNWTKLDEGTLSGSSVLFSFVVPQGDFDPASGGTYDLQTIFDGDARYHPASGTGILDVLADGDGDGYTADVDCNDSDYSVHPGADEACNGVDDDCDGDIDEALVRACGEGACEGEETCTSGQWGACSSEGQDAGVCAVCEGGVAVYDGSQHGDCAATQCPESGCGAGGCGEQVFGTYPETVENTCSAIYTCTQNECVADCEEDADGDGYSPSCGDCDDGDPEVNPEAEEVCDGIDNDCDGQVDLGDADEDGVDDCEDRCLGTGADGAASRRLLPWHFADVDGDGVLETRTGWWRGEVTDSQYDLTDTHGCNCGQILECLPGKNRGQTWFGCSYGTIRVWVRQIGWARDCQVHLEEHRQNIRERVKGRFGRGR